MNKFFSIITLVAGLLFTSCSDDLQFTGGVGTPPVPDGTPIEISSAIEIPEMSSANNSRNLRPDIDKTYLKETLKIHLFVFDGTGAMRQFIEGNDIEITSTNDSVANFMVKNIYASSEPRTLHFVIVPNIEDLRTIKGGEYIDAMANETVVMPALQIGNQTDAYWGRVRVDSIKAKTKVQLKAVRNFAKINVTSDLPANDFKIKGFAIVNKPELSLIAPYRTKDHLFADFYEIDGKPKSYEDVTKEQGFVGINPSTANENMFCTTESEVRTDLNTSTGAINNQETNSTYPIPYPQSLVASTYYIYERSQSNLDQASSSAKVTYLILQTSYNRHSDTYYKIDIGREEYGKFKYYDLIRNFEYTIKINKVLGDGAGSLQEAMNGAASNNISASIVTRDLFSIGYENDKIEVSTTRAFITRNNSTYHFRFRYTIEGKTDKVNSDSLFIYDVVNENNPDAKHTMAGVGDDYTQLDSLVSKGKDPVIKSAKVKRDGDWYDVEIETHNLPESSAERYEQTLKVYYTGGSYLSRNFTIMLCQPWEYTLGFKDSEEQLDTIIGTERNEQIEIGFKMLAGLSKTQFPIVVTFESDKQNIYAVPGEELTVSFVNSQFDGATTDNVISYERRVEWDEYDSENGSWFTVNFKINTTADEDNTYKTPGIDGGTNEGRLPSANNRFCIRIGDRNPDGMKYFKPKYLNYTRQ